MISFYRFFDQTVPKCSSVPIVLYRCETITFRKADDQRLIGCDRKVLCRIFGPVQNFKPKYGKLKKNSAKMGMMYNKSKLVTIKNKKILT